MPFYATLEAQDAAADTRYILVDKSDGTNFPHTADAALKVDSLIVNLDKEGTGNWEVRIGVVQEVDATNGSVKFFHVSQIRSAATEPVNYQVVYHSQAKRELVHGHIVSTNDASGSTNWQTDVNLTNPAGTTTGPDAGDIVMEIDEDTGTSTLSFSITVEYSHA